MTSHSFGRLANAVFDRYLLVPIGALLALIWANTAAESYYTFSIRSSFVVNEIGMAIFIGLVTQEIVDAVMPGGALHTWRRWTLPLIAAAGGVAGSVLVFLAYVNLSYETVLTMGWPVATAVDLAAAYFLMKLIFRRSSPVYPFLLLVAVATDAFALTAIAARQFVVATMPGAAGLLLVAVGLAAFLWQRRVQAFWPYLLICAPLSWLAFYWDGLHPALSLVPIVPFLPHRPRGLDLLENGHPSASPVRQIEHEWAYIVQPVVFLFGLVNGGVSFTSYGTGSWAVVSAALVGRPIGILVAVGIAVAAGWHLPHRASWRELVVVAFTTSGGFTLALFAASAVFPLGPLLGEAKIGALLTAGGALVALAAARLLHVGRFADHPPLLHHPGAARATHAMGLLIVAATLGLCG